MPLKIHLLTGPSEDPSTLTPTPPNPLLSTPPTRISPTTRLRIHIRDFSGHPAPKITKPGYFSHQNHKSDLFSIHYFFTPPEDIPGDDLILSNTFSRPIRDHLPYFFPAAWKALQWVDPGISGDVYAERPEVYSRVLGAANYLSTSITEEAGLIGEDMPKDVPGTPKERRRYFLDVEKRKKWCWRKGREYCWDFCNGMMDFNDFSVRIPGLGFKIDVFKYWDGQPLRFVLKNKRTGEVYGVVQVELREEDEVGMEVKETEV